MKWKKYTIDTTTAAIDFISEMQMQEMHFIRKNIALLLKK